MHKNKSIGKTSRSRFPTTFGGEERHVNEKMLSMYEDTPAKVHVRHRTPTVNFGRQKKRPLTDFFSVGSLLESPAPNKYRPKSSTGTRLQHSFPVTTGPRSCSEIRPSEAFPRPISASRARSSRDFVRENITLAPHAKDFVSNRRIAQRLLRNDKVMRAKARRTSVDEVAARAKLVSAKHQEIKEAEERKAAYLLEQQSTQMLWLEFMLQVEVVGSIQGIMEERETFRALAEARIQAQKVLTRTVVALKFKWSMCQHAHALAVIRRAARAAAQFRIFKRNSTAAKLILQFCKDHAHVQLLKQKIKWFKEGVIRLQRFWKKQRITMQARAGILGMQWVAFEKQARQSFIDQREALESQLVDQFKRPVLYDDSNRIGIEDLPEIPAPITARVKARVFSNGLRERAARHSYALGKYQEEVVKQYYRGKAPPRVLKSYKQVMDTKFEPKSLRPPMLRLLATQEELGALYAQALEFEQHRGRDRIGAQANRAFGETRDYRIFGRSSLFLSSAIKGAPLPAEQFQAPKETRVQAQAMLNVSTPRSYFKYFGTLSEVGTAVASCEDRGEDGGVPMLAGELEPNGEGTESELEGLEGSASEL